jgi:hypothetical protein
MYPKHHLRSDEISTINFSQYTVGISFCRHIYSPCVLVHKNIQFHTVNLDQFNKEKDHEICALKLKLMSKNFTIICICTSPTGNFSYFLNQLESVLNKLHKTSTELVLYGDFNTNDLDDNLFSMINFSTRIFNNSCTSIDKTCTNTCR